MAGLRAIARTNVQEARLHSLPTPGHGQGRWHGVGFSSRMLTGLENSSVSCTSKRNMDSAAAGMMRSATVPLAGVNLMALERQL